ncbi:MAG: zinc ribbon domain-containing protein [Acidobacteriota bacterium]|nr:zinc ribbon domain-containing protein [Acidobacteriota bacterium]
MPLYEYQCESCSHRFERIQKFSDPPVDTCPQCSGKVRKLISSPAIQFKGSGFYLTDYGRGGKSDLGTGAAKESTASTPAGETKSETKTETKTETKAETPKADKPAAKPAT